MKDDAGTKFAWVADNPEIEDRAIAAMEQASSVGLAAERSTGRDPGATFRRYGSAIPGTAFFRRTGALDTEFVLGKEFIRDIAKIEPQSVWDNGSTGEMWAGWMPPRIKYCKICDGYKSV